MSEIFFSVDLGTVTHRLMFYMTYRENEQLEPFQKAVVLDVGIF